MRGLNEVVRGFNKLNRTAAREIQKELKKAAVPVVDTSKELLSRYTGASVGTIRPRASGASIYVTQGARKVTGKRGDFGVLQQHRVLEVALDERQGEVVEILERQLDTFLDNF